MAEVEMPGRLLLALDPAMLTHVRGARTPHPRSEAGFAAWPADDLHPLDLAMLCSLPRSPPRTNQSAVTVTASTVSMASMAASLLPRLPQPASLHRQARSASPAGNAAQLPPGCQWAVQSNADDDDSTSEPLNWTDGAVHCSYAGLTAIPPLPANAQYLYVQSTCILSRPAC